MTDDHEVVVRLKALAPDMEIDSLCTATERGYLQGEFNLLTGPAKTTAIQRMVSEVEVAIHSQIFVGCYTSNVSRYVALAHRCPGNCFSADSQRRWHPL